MRDWGLVALSIQKKIYALKSELAGRYQLGEEHHNICGRKIGVTCVEDAEALFDKLGMADPDSVEVQDERLPYWATLWDSALVLSDVLLADNLIAPGESVLELGCGLGLVSSIACLKRARVTATDYQPDALKFTQLNGLQIAGVAPRDNAYRLAFPAARSTLCHLVGGRSRVRTAFFRSSHRRIRRPSVTGRARFIF